MSFNVLLFVWLSCGLALAQEGGNAPETETSSCFPDMCKLLKDFGALRERQGAVEAKLEESGRQVLELKNKENYNVVFSAAIGGTGAAIGPLDKATTLIYQTVITNIGNAYNPLTGIFAAPVAGIYHFTFFYHAGGNHPVSLLLIKNNQAVVTAYDHRTTHDGADNGGNAVFLQLQQGDQVFMRLGANSNVWGNTAITTFSGVLLKQI